jgi:hypothetical protein
MKVTVRLFVMMLLLACGFIATMECVHISRRWMVATILGPRKSSMNPCRLIVSTVPRSAPAAKTPSDAST